MLVNVVLVALPSSKADVPERRFSNEVHRQGCGRGAFWRGELTLKRGRMRLWRRLIIVLGFLEKGLFAKKFVVGHYVCMLVCGYEGKLVYNEEASVASLQNQENTLST